MEVTTSKSKLTIGINIINTISNVNEAILEAFNAQAKPKKPKTVEDLKCFQMEDNYGTADSKILKSLYLRVNLHLKLFIYCSGRVFPRVCEAVRRCRESVETIAGYGLRCVFIRFALHRELWNV
jgi:hypothetical protein